MPKPDGRGAYSHPQWFATGALSGHQARVIVTITEGPRKDSAARWGPKGSPAALSHSTLMGSFCRLNYVLPKCVC